MTGFVGIDVSAKELTVAYLRPDTKAQLSTFEQSPSGHRKLVKYLKKRRVEAIVLEATGIYYLDAAIALHEAGLPVSVINPRSAHHFAKAILETSKTDRIDAGMLAEYARRMDLKAWQPPRRSWLAVRDIGRRINQLTAARTAAKNRQHALEAKAFTDPVVLADVVEEIEALERRIERLSQVGLERIRDDAKLSTMFDRLISTTGVAQASALALLSEMCLLDPTLKSAQVCRYAGLDVRLCESGSSVQGQSVLSKAGNAYLRGALYMPTLSLVRHDPIARAHYEQLVARGKKKMQALCAVQRKLLTGLWACIRNQEMFDSAKLFAIRP